MPDPPPVITTVFLVSSMTVIDLSVPLYRIGQHRVRADAVLFCQSTPPFLISASKHESSGQSNGPLCSGNPHESDSSECHFSKLHDLGPYSVRGGGLIKSAHGCMLGLSLHPDGRLWDRLNRALRTAPGNDARLSATMELPMPGVGRNFSIRHGFRDDCQSDVIRCLGRAGPVRRERRSATGEFDKPLAAWTFGCLGQTGRLRPHGRWLRHPSRRNCFLGNFL